MRRIGDLVQETHRRAVWQVLGTYVAGAWVVLQVIEVLMETIGLPDWVPRMSLVLLLLGLPIVIATAVVQGAARGRSRPASDEESPGDPTGAVEDAASDAPIRPDADARIHDDARAGDSVRGSVFTWRNVAFAGLGGFALLGVVTAGWMTMRTLGIGPVGSLVASGVIEEGERIILADLAGDSTIATAATLALRVDLDESEVVSTVDPASVGAVLSRMQRSPGGRLDAELAREVAIRSGTKAVLEGEVTPLGGSHVLTVRLVAAGTGEQLASFRETAKSDDDLLDAIDRLSRKLRERLGESLRSIHGSEALADVTTGSLEALRKYSQAWAAINAGNDATGRQLLEEAVSIDSTFAMAWRKLATATFGDRRVEAATRAYEFRDRLTDRERYHTLGIYHSYVTGDQEEAARAYRTLLDSHPDDAVALNNLGVVYGNQGEHPLSAEMYGRAAQVDSLTATYVQNLIFSLYRQGRTDSAGTALATYGRNLPDHAELSAWTFRYASAEHDYERAGEAIQKLLMDPDLPRRRQARLGEAWLVLIAGRLGEAERLWDQLAVDDAPDTRLERALERAAELELRVRGDTAAAVRDAVAALERYDIHDLPIPEWPLDDLLFLFAEARRPELVRSLALEWVEGMGDVVPSEDHDRLRRLIDSYLETMTILNSEDPTGAADGMRRVVELAHQTGNCDSLCTALWLATAHDVEGHADSAVVWFQRYLDTPVLDRLSYDSQNLHRVYLRLGQLYDGLGDAERARRYYGLFETLWSDADPRLMPRVEVVRTRLGELLEASAPGGG